MRRYSLLFCFVALFCCAVSAQTDTAQVLPSVEVVGSPLRARPAGAAFDTVAIGPYRSGNLADMLSQKSGIYIKSYGLGSLATTAMRGGGAAQTAVVWNGLPLQGPMLGLVDLSLVPLLFVDNAAVQYGSNGAAWGSGAVGGAILLDNASGVPDGCSAEVGAGVGSFGWQQQTLALRYGGGRLGSTTRLFREQADNDFTFRARPDLPERRQQHAALHQQGVLQEFFWRAGPKQTLTLRTWLQHTAREIPPTTVQNASQATQNDGFARTALHWKRAGKTWIWQARAAYFAEKIRYSDPTIRLMSDSRFGIWTGEVEADWAPGARTRLQGALTQTHARANTPAYGEARAQHRTALFTAFSRTGKRWRAQLDNRLEVADGALVPPTPSLGGAWDALPYLTLKARVARSYRLPTLNDRYWRPGGNPDLLPEDAWSREAGVLLRRQRGPWRFAYSLTGYDRRLRNSILWAQQTGQPFFSPQNIAEVHSRGLEQRFDVARTLQGGQVSIAGGHDLARSTNERAIARPMIAAGTQLFYVPLHRAYAEIAVRHKALQVGAQQQFTSGVIGLNEPVPAFTTGSLHLQYTGAVGSYSGRMFARMENLWDASYQVIERRPMPGRHFRIGISVGYAHLKPCLSNT